MDKNQRVKNILKRELAVVYQEVSAGGDSWFKSLSPKQQKEYVKLHPGSKFGASAPTTEPGPHKFPYSSNNDNSMNALQRKGVHVTKKGQDFTVHYHPHQAKMIYGHMRNKFGPKDSKLPKAEQEKQFQQDQSRYAGWSNLIKHATQYGKN